MNMYNTVFGQNPLAASLLGMLDLTTEQVGRFRDCYVDGDLIAVYTRNGGGNREDYQDVIDTLRAHPQFLRDADDDFDATYATFWFRVPPGYEGLVAAFRRDDERPPAERWAAFLDALHRGEETPETRAARAKLKPLIDQIAAFFKGSPS